MEPAISVKNITKIYRLYEKPSDRLKESLLFSGRSLHEDFYALRDVSFDVGKGETVGIIGVNGSGKSTILKIITRVLSPTLGEVETHGRISALLELGAGFNGEYTGIENIYMNGTMLGMTHDEMDRRMDEILEFADIGEFAKQPVKSYSSGMFVRLAFALAINVDADILIVDEALSVGDIFFQAKCYERMEELRKLGTTILMVTHDMSSILKYSDRAIVLNRGIKAAEGRPGQMVDLYKKILSGQDEQFTEMLAEFSAESSENIHIDRKPIYLAGSGRERASVSPEGGEKPMRDSMTVNPYVDEYGDGRAEIVDFGIIDHSGKLTNLILKGETFTIREKIRFRAHIASPIFTYTVRDRKGNDLSGTNTLFEGTPVGDAEAGDEYVVEFTQRMDLQGGEYLVGMSCTGYEGGELKVFHRLYNLLSLTVISNKNTVGVFDMNSKVSVRKE